MSLCVSWAGATLFVWRFKQEHNSNYFFLTHCFLVQFLFCDLLTSRSITNIFSRQTKHAQGSGGCGSCGGAGGGCDIDW